MNTIIKNKYLVLVAILCITQILLLSCNNNSIEKSNLAQSDGVAVSSAVETGKEDYKYYDVLNISPAKIIIPKNQTISQSLSVLVNDGCGNLIVFDGGRVEDADYLCDIIKDNGGIVTTWFITHIHDDHIGALYKILNDKRTDITIKEIVYDFADFDWYYSKMGNDAGIYYIFEDAIKNYNVYLHSINKDEINIINHSNIGTQGFSYHAYLNNSMLISDNTKMVETNKNETEVIVDSLIEVTPLNSVFTLDQDPINNTSIVYLVSLFNNKYSMLIFGDLGYEGGNKLFEYLDRSDNENLAKKVYSSDIVALAHHGQNGIDPEFYKRFSPKVVIWPTSKDIYENTHGTYYTDDTKKVLSEIKSIEYQIKSYEETAIIR